jgi:hypothetical protein
MRGSVDCNPKAGLYRVTGPGEGERVRLGAGPLVTAADLLCPKRRDSGGDLNGA